MNKNELVDRLKELASDSHDPESSHLDADMALIAYINDPEVEEAYNAVYKWYA